MRVSEQSQRYFIRSIFDVHVSMRPTDQSPIVSAIGVIIEPGGYDDCAPAGTVNNTLAESSTRPNPGGALLRDVPTVFAWSIDRTRQMAADSSGGGRAGQREELGGVQTGNQLSISSAGRIRISREVGGTTDRDGGRRLRCVGGTAEGRVVVPALWLPSVGDFCTPRESNYVDQLPM